MGKVSKQVVQSILTEKGHYTTIMTGWIKKRTKWASQNGFHFILFGCRIHANFLHEMFFQIT